MNGNLPKQHKKHFDTLDGLRGFAAFAVCLYHILRSINAHQLLARGYLAVDFFFVLSGFVIAIAYENRLLSQLTFAKFFEIRMLRLYPLLLMGMLCGGFVTIAKAITWNLGIAGFGENALYALALMPFGQAQSHIAFPFNAPAWSLFYELLINFVYAGTVAFLTNGRLLAIISITAGAIFFVTAHHGIIDVGLELNQFWPALARVTFSFASGILLGRYLRAGYLENFPGVHTLWLAAILLCTFCAPASFGGGTLEAVIVVFVFPALIVFGANNEPSVGLRPLAAMAGRLSYPLYILHYPIVRVFEALIETRQIHGWALGAVIIVEVLVVFAFSFLALVFYDEPVRRFLSARLSRSAVRMT